MLDVSSFFDLMTNYDCPCIFQAYSHLAREIILFDICHRAIFLGYFFSPYIQKQWRLVDSYSALMVIQKMHRMGFYILQLLKQWGTCWGFHFVLVSGLGMHTFLKMNHILILFVHFVIWGDVLEYVLNHHSFQQCCFIWQPTYSRRAMREFGKYQIILLYFSKIKVLSDTLLC